MSSKVIIGIDPGTVVTGYGIIEVNDSSLILIDYGCIKPPPKYNLSDRYLIIYDAVASLLDKYPIKAMAIELQFVSKNPQSAIKLGMARGVIVLAARKKEIETFGYTPKKAKLAVTGSGNASKYQVGAMVQQHFRLPAPPQPEDAADALALAICHAHALKTTQLLGEII